MTHIKIGRRTPRHSRSSTRLSAISIFVLDAEAPGHGWKVMVDQIWAREQPEDAETIIGEFLKRVRWMTTTGYKLILAMDPTPREKSLDGLVSSGAMTWDERAFLDSPEGVHMWPRPEH